MIECQQSSPKPFACYASAPNDVWSLGVILVNLTCGRNPWKRASMDDSTFRAFMRDPDFLQTILPISDGLNYILQRIFEVDPKRRITLEALREYIMLCPQLSSDPVESSLPPTPPYSPVEKPVDPSLVVFGNGLGPVPNLDPLPVQQYPRVSRIPFNAPIPSLAPISIPSPPISTNTSSRQSLHTYPTRTPPASVVYSPSASQVGFLPSISSWSRCTNFVPNLAQHPCFRNVAVF